MKKLLLAAAALALTVSGYAQGTILFSNTSSTLVTTNSGGSLKTTSSGGDFKVALYWGSQGSLESELVQIGTNGVQSGGTANAGISPVSGRFNVSTPYVTGTGTAAGGTGTFQVRAWSGGYNTYELALASGLSSVYVGKSLLWNNATGGAGAPPSAPTSFAGFQGFSVAPVPEPSTIALGVLGAGSLLFLRRKK